MNILLTGGLGYIGSHTAVELLTNNNKVCIFDNLSNGDGYQVKRLTENPGAKTNVQMHCHHSEH